MLSWMLYQFVVDAWGETQSVSNIMHHGAENITPSDENVRSFCGWYALCNIMTILQWKSTGHMASPGIGGSTLSHGYSNEHSTP